MEVKEMKQLKYIDFAKGIAMLFVIFSHVYSYVDKPVDSLLITISTLHDSTFYMASGILFYGTGLKLKKGLNIHKKVLFKKGISLLIPFVFWSLFYAIVVYEISSLLEMNENAFLYYFVDAMNRLWFLPVLFLVFVLFVLFHKFLENYRIIAGGGSLYCNLFIIFYNSSKSSCIYSYCMDWI